MCTAVSLFNENHYFGRTLDVCSSYNEEIVITPRNFPLKYRCIENQDSHFAIMGMATVIDDFPLYYEAVNEKGLCIAGLNFPENADYKPLVSDKKNIAPFELILYLLSTSDSVENVKKELENINIININFKDSLPLSPLHWIVSDNKASVTVECVKDGLKIYENKIGVLTNNPPFPFHITNLNNYASLSTGNPINNFSENIDFLQLSLGMGAFGLPGDFSSVSRFIRTAFIKSNAVLEGSEQEKVSAFLRILSSVSMIKGCVKSNEDTFEFTKYMCCINATKGIYYCTSYENFSFCEVSMFSEDLEKKELYRHKIN